MRDVVGGNLRRGRAGRSGSLQDVVEEEQQAEHQCADGSQLKRRHMRISEASERRPNDKSCGIDSATMPKRSSGAAQASHAT